MKSLLPVELQSSWNVRDTKSRRERFTELAYAGYRIPRCGEFKNMVRLGVPLVVYTDEYAHCGEGKVLFRPRETPQSWPAETFCSEYIQPIGEGAVTNRILVMGDYVCHICYRSTKSWMSNVDGTYDVFRYPILIPGFRKTAILRYPMYAIDRVVDGNSGDLIAVDLNVCPGVPVGVVNAVGRDVLQESIARFCKNEGLI